MGFALLFNEREYSQSPLKKKIKILGKILEEQEYIIGRKGESEGVKVF